MNEPNESGQHEVFEGPRDDYTGQVEWYNVNGEVFTDQVEAESRAHELNGGDAAIDEASSNHFFNQ